MLIIEIALGIVLAIVLLALLPWLFVAAVFVYLLYSIWVAATQYPLDSFLIIVEIAVMLAGFVWIARLSARLEERKRLKREQQSKAV